MQWEFKHAFCMLSGTSRDVVTELKRLNQAWDELSADVRGAVLSLIEVSWKLTDGDINP